jgi:hypothetical protein
MTSKILIRLCLATIAAATASAGCTSSSSPPSTGVLDYQSSGGLSGNGDGSELHVTADRTARRVTRQGGSQTATLDAATFNDLRARIEAAEFTTLEPMYSCSCADDFVDMVSVQLSDTTYAVSADTSADIPERLQALVDTIHGVIAAPLDWR